MKTMTGNVVMFEVDALMYRGADNLLPDVFCLMVRIIRLLLVLLYIQGVSRL